MKKHPNEPSRFAEWFLKQFTPPGVAGSSILGDVREEYVEHARSHSRISAATRYWRSVLSIGFHFVGRSPERRDTPGHHRRKRAGIEILGYELQLAIRNLLRKPIFTAAVILTLSLGIGANTTESSIVTEAGAFSGSRAIVALPVGVRWNRMKGDLRARAVKPYLAAGFGPVIGSSTGSSVDFMSAFAGTQSAATAGAFFGAGVDVHTGRWCSIGVGAGYSLMADFSRPIGGRDNYSGFQVTVSLGLLFGKGYRERL
jgi:hypothetical protein